MIGFVMYIYDTLDHESFLQQPFYNKHCYFIWHYMLDKRYQQQGFGRQAFEQLMIQLQTEPHGPAQYIALFYDERNTSAASLYTSCGFVNTGIHQQQSILLVKSIK